MKISLISRGANLPTLELMGAGVYRPAKGRLDKIAGTDRAVQESVRKQLARTRFDGKAGETYLAAAPGGKGLLFLIGLGPKEKGTLETVRNAAAALVAEGKRLRKRVVGLSLETFKGAFSEEETISAAVEGIRLSGYFFDRYKTAKNKTSDVEQVCLVLSGRASRAASQAAANAEIISASVNFARDLANEPANRMTPSRLAQAAREMARTSHLSCRVLDKPEIKKLKMGGLLGVAQGSVEEPKFIILENRVQNASAKKPVVLVGKGITFDTGGISLKPPARMDEMKFDMCGAAAVIGALRAIGQLKLPVKVIGLVPTCENMPGGRAQRPGDIITCMNGKTVEVLNTDAEGRLILADALSYAKKYKPSALVDIATLTGMCAHFFGDSASGLMATDPGLAKRLVKAGEKTGERCWELPLWDEYGELIRATYADIQNISKRKVGTMTAGMFLKEFAEHTRQWAHLDVAGTAWLDAPKPLFKIGATGVGVRLFVELARSYLKK